MCQFERTLKKEKQRSSDGCAKDYQLYTEKIVHEITGHCNKKVERFTYYPPKFVDTRSHFLMMYVKSSVLMVNIDVQTDVDRIPRTLESSDMLV